MYVYFKVLGLLRYTVFLKGFTVISAVAPIWSIGKDLAMNETPSSAVIIYSGQTL